MEVQNGKNWTDYSSFSNIKSNDSNQRLKEYGLTSNEGSVLMF